MWMGEEEGGTWIAEGAENGGGGGDSERGDGAGEIESGVEGDEVAGELSSERHDFLNKQYGGENSAVTVREEVWVMMT